MYAWDGFGHKNKETGTVPNVTLYLIQTGMMPFRLIPCLELITQSTQF